MNQHIARILIGSAVVLGVAAKLATAGADSDASTVTTCLPPVAPTLTSEVPSDTPIADQPSINCLAWQQFIALNWPAVAQGGGKPAPLDSSEFGRPGDMSPVVWETYMDIHQVMTPDGSAPAPWGTPQAIPEVCAGSGAPGNRALQHTSKFTLGLVVPDDLSEAFPLNKPNWLADRDGNVVLYEILINRDEFEYINQTRILQWPGPTDQHGLGHAHQCSKGGVGWTGRLHRDQGGVADRRGSATAQMEHLQAERGLRLEWV